MKESEIACANALKIALAAKANLNIFHVHEKRDDEEWTDFPGVRSMLERWGILPVGGSRAEVGKLGLGIQKVLMRGKDPVASILWYLDKHNTDMIVLTTDQHAGLDRWLHQAVAEPIARLSRRYDSV